MSGGFNTNVRVAGRVFHIQTEDRGPAHPKIDTVVYLDGRVVHKTSSPYTSAQGTDTERRLQVRAQVEDQHRQIIESLKAGTLVDVGDGGHSSRAPVPAPSAARGISVTLLNAASWMLAGNADLKVAVRDRGHDNAPVSGARVTAKLDGIPGQLAHEAISAEDGSANIRFPLPAGGVGGATLVIRATAPAGEHEISFHLRAKSKEPAPRK